MRDLSKFGSSEFPLSASALQALAKCPWRGASMFLFMPGDEAGPAADTGTAVHAAAHEFHNTKGDLVAAVEKMVAEQANYPQADLVEAAKLFYAYAQDPRNQSAQVIVQEQRVQFEIKPAPEDPTQAPIVIKGRIDQVREVNGSLRNDDIKTSTRLPPIVMAESMFQMAAYSVGATILLGRPVQPGALIMPRQYLKRGAGHPSTAPPGVFWHYVFKLEHCDVILNGLRHIVAAIRGGNVWANGGEYCNWCHFRGIDSCLPALVQIGRK